MNETSSLLRSRRALFTAARLLPLCAALFAVLAMTAPAAFAQSGNPWLANRFLNMAHQGGELEAPSNTMYALKSAIAERGADSLELDVNATQDDELIVIHDQTVNRTTNDTGRVDEKTADEIQALDAAFWFVPGENTPHSGHSDEEYVFRGVRTGDVAPPPGYTADDFAHPTLEQVLDEFPDVPINIEIKGDSQALREHTAHLLAEVLTRPAYASREDIIVVAFGEDALEAFKSEAPNVDLAASEDKLLEWTLDQLGGGTQTLPAGTVALQVPPTYELGGNPVDVPSLLLNPPIDAHGKGYAVHIWTDGEQDETRESYERLIGLGVDGIMTQTPGRLHEYLCSADVPRPDGSARCQISFWLEVRKQKLRRARSRGIHAKFGCSGPCAVDLEATVGKRAAKRAGIWPRRGKGKRLSLGAESVEPGDAYGAGEALIGLRRKVARKLRKYAGNLRVRVAATADWAGSDPVTVKRSVKLEGKRKRG